LLAELPAKDIALNGMGKLRVKYNIRKLTGIASTKDVALNVVGKIRIAASEKLAGIASRIAVQRHCP
jgi:hypothetical protein